MHNIDSASATIPVSSSISRAQQSQASHPALYVRRNKQLALVCSIAMADKENMLFLITMPPTVLSLLSKLVSLYIKPY